MIPEKVGEVLQNAEARYYGSKGGRQCHAWQVSQRKWPLSWPLNDEQWRKRGSRGGEGGGGGWFGGGGEWGRWDRSGNTEAGREGPF